MTVTPLVAPLSGEHALAVSPRITYPTVDAGWLRRLRPFPGRAVDADALTAEQDARGGRLRVLGTTLAPGIALGLEVDHERADGTDWIRVAPGIGVLPDGEDVVVGRELRIRVEDLATDGVAAARAAVLVLVPAEARIAGRFDPDDPCDRDETEDAFADHQRVDAVHVELVPWDDAWIPLDDATARRSPLAWAIFARERAAAPGATPPWRARGLPVALLGLDAGAVRWLDRHAVARRGGHARPRAPLVGGARAAGTPALWQAQLLQLAEHLDELAATGGALPTVADAGLVRLPPAGVIPRGAVELETMTNRFFPPIWQLRAAPVPLEQLDGVLARAAALAPLDPEAAEGIVVLAPVPQAVYEPRLLEVEAVGPAFQTAIDRFVAERTEWLGRRRYLRGRRDALARAIDGEAPADPDPDPEALEDEGEIAEVADGEDDHGVEVVDGTPRPTALRELRERIDASPLFDDAQRAALYDDGLVAFIAALERRLRQGDDAVDFGFLKAQADIYRVRQYMLGTTLASKLATSPAIAEIARGETAHATRENLAALFVALKQPATTPPSPEEGGGGGGVGGGPLFRVVQPTTVRISTLGLMSRAMAESRLPGVGAPEAPALAVGPTGIVELPGVPGAVDGGLATLAAARAPGVGVGAGAAGITIGGPATTEDVLGSQPIIGGYDFRTVTIAERISEPAAAEARQYAVTTRFEGVTALASLAEAGLAVDDLPVYAVPTTDGRADTTFGAIRDRLGDLLADAPPRGVEEASHFHDAVTMIEAHVGTLRKLEGRIAAYRTVLRDAQAVLAGLRATGAAIARRLAEVDAGVTERRHAVATARALLAEETLRVERINARRRAVLEQHVRVLAYVRPRHVDGLVEVPEVPLDPALLESPVPGCLARHGEPPDELEQMIALLREAPVRWFRRAPGLLAPLDRVELLHGALVTARRRADALAAAGGVDALAPRPLAGRFGSAITAIGRVQATAIFQPRTHAVALDLRALVGRGWQESHEIAREIVSLGDLIEGERARGATATAAQRELGAITRVATCLWAQTGDAAPEIRLAWAEALSQHAPGRGVRALDALPRWRDVPYRDRKEIELLAEWLVDRVDPAIPEAVAWMFDLVRICVLLASHAPVDEIIAGHLPAPAPASPGSLVTVAIDPVKVRLGMRVDFYLGDRVVARGAVEDLVGAQARARIAEAIEPTLRLEAATTRVRFVRAAAPAPPLGLAGGAARAPGAG